MKPVIESSIRPLGTDSDQRRRFLFHHLPLALASALLLLVFMTVPLFDVGAYGHRDIMSGAFPQARGDGGPMGHGAARGGEHDGAQTRLRDHGGDHAGRTSHSGHRPPGVRPPAEPESTAHAGRDAGSRHGGSNTETQDQRADSSLSRRVQQFTVATGYLGVVFLALTLLLGPANLLLRRRNPVSSYLRRDVGIWTAIFSLAHVVAAVLVHVSHGSSVTSSVVHFFVTEDGRPLTNSFGIGNWTGLAASVIVLGLLATSSDVALRKLKAAPWKWLQRLTYALLALVILHAFFYGAFLRMASPFTLLLVLSIIAVVVGQSAGFWVWRRRRLV
ncbi:MAG: ferric reductase-like transmembrane domain-containing protein [Acidobacteria bacterium]|nr:ferric reductase-like transmembrane domain-containing protein [Acidobacteriota bacterium]